MTRLTAFSILMTNASLAFAGELKKPTVKAWEDYLEVAKSQMKARLNPRTTFLWSDELPLRHSQVSKGAIVVEPSVESGVTIVSDGLIHDWIGADFLPNTSLDQVLEVTEDYNRYKEIYSPNVASSHTLAPDPEGDRLSLRIVNKMSIITAAMDTEYIVQTVRVNSTRSYDISQSTKVQQIRNYGKASQVKLPPGQGDGFIWELCSISRYEERDGGVYVELQAIVLTRDIPSSLRWLVGPLTARMSRNSMLISLAQMRKAVYLANPSPALVNSATAVPVRKQQ